MPGEPGSTETPLSIRANPDRPRGTQQPDTTPNTQTANPKYGGIGMSLENASRRLMGPALAVLMAIGVAKGAQIANQPTGNENTGYTPNQPGQTEKPKPTAEPTQPELSFWQNNSWVNEVRQKLNGEGLTGNEVFPENMKIISLGEPDVIGPNLREYPSNFVPPGAGTDLTEVPILGILMPGGTIDRGMIVHGTVMRGNQKIDVTYVAFKLGDFHGTIVNGDRQPVGINPQDQPDRIVVAARAYMQPQAQIH